MSDAASHTPRCRACRAVLALDNRTGRCGTCTTTARATLAGPPAIGPGFWDHPALAAALAEQHIGHVIAAYRRHPAHSAPVRQSDVARWAGISQVRVSRIEKGSPIRHLDALTYWAKLLEIPPHLLWFRPPGIAPAATPVRVHAAPTGTGAYRLLRFGSGHRGTEDPDIAALQAFRSADGALGGGNLYSEVVHYLTTQIGPRMFSGEDGADTKKVFVAAAGLVEMAGWMAHDAGHDERAHRQFTRALELSKVGSDRQLHVHVLASLSHLELHRTKPAPDSAIRYAYDAETALTKAPANPELSARLLAMQARGFAARGQARQAHAFLDRAEHALDTTVTIELSPWVSRFDHGSLASEAARCWRQLGELPRAAESAQRILELRPADRARSRAFAHLTLACILAEQGHPEQACTIAGEVIDNTGDLASYLVVRHLTDLRDQLRAYPTSPTVIAFGERLREASRARTWIPSMVTNQPEPSPERTR